MPMYFFHGVDRYARLEAVAQLREQHAGDGSLANNSAAFDAARLKLSDLEAAVSAAPFLGDMRFVRVDGLCGRFQPRGRGRGGGRGGGRGLGDWDGLEEMLSRVPATTLLVFVDDEVGRNNPIRKMLESALEQGHAREFAPLKEREALDWLRAQVRARGLHLTQGAARSLVERANGDRGGLSQAVEKLQLYAGEASIDEAVVEQLVPSVRRVTIFNLVDAVAEGRLADAMRALDGVRAEGESATRILQMIARQMRQIVIAREVIDRGGTDAELETALKTRASWLAKRIRRQAERYTQARADAALERLLEADRSIMDYRRDEGGLPEDLAVELLVADLARPSPRVRRVRRVA